MKTRIHNPYKMYKLTLLLTLTLLSSCQDVINVDLNNSSPQMVIEGSISNMPDTVKVYLSQTTDYFNPQNITFITGATVTISDDKGNSYTPTIAAGGTYLFPSLSGIPQGTYTLKVQTGNSQYIASSVMPEKVTIDSMTVEGSDDGDKENVLLVYIHDPLGIENFYRIKVFINGVLAVPSSGINPILIYSDKYFDGRVTPLRITSRRIGLDYFKSTDNIKVQLMSIDQVTYNYFRQLRDLTNSGRPLSTSTPDNPDNNISNGALGYFAAWAIDEKSIDGR